MNTLVNDTKWGGGRKTKHRYECVKGGKKVDAQDVVWRYLRKILEKKK